MRCWARPRCDRLMIARWSTQSAFIVIVKGVRKSRHICRTQGTDASVVVRVAILHSVAPSFVVRAEEKPARCGTTIRNQLLRRIVLTIEAIFIKTRRR